MQAIQEVFTAEEWVKDARNEARLAYNLRVKTSKALGIAEQKNKELTTKLVTKDRGRKSAKVGFKNAQAQDEEQCQKLNYTEIKLATANQQVVELEKAKEATWAAQVVADALGQKFYDLRVQETEARLTEELAGFCMDYCQKVSIEALNLVKVPTALEWRRVENVYCPQDL